MLIRIINGTYGHRPTLANGEKSNFIVPVTRNDLPIEVDEKEAQRLVEAGVAQYVTIEAVATDHVAPEADNPIGNTPEGEDGTEDAGEPENEHVPFEEPAFTTDMRADELRAAMRERGLTVKIGMTKAEMVAALNGTEDLPELTVQDVVEE